MEIIEHTGLVRAGTDQSLTALAPLAEQAREYAAKARSGATVRAYAVQWRAFESWCREHGLSALPAEPAAVALYLTHRARSKASVATMAQALAAISQTHQRAGQASPRTAPEVREVWAGIRREHGTRQRQAAPVGPSELRRMVRAGKGLGGVRDRALLLVGFAGALRRSELVKLDVADIQPDPDGLRVLVRRSKTDQDGQGREVGVPFGSDPSTCPVRGLREWLEKAGISEGAVFRGVRYGKVTGTRLGGGDVSRIVKRAAKRARVRVENLSGHSLRAGLATTAARMGKPAHVIAKHTGHKSLAMVQRYIRGGELFTENAAAGIGL